MKLIPIAIVTHDRINHLKKTINSLLSNKISKFQEIYIFLDAPCSNAYIQNNNQITEYVNSLNGFKHIKLIKHQKNIGAHNNFEYAINYLFNQYEELIFLEDDIIVSTNFLSFMNQAMKYFRNDDKCISVSGFTYNLRPTNSDIYRSNYLFAWGMGLFKNKYISHSEAYSDWKKKLLNPFFTIKLIFNYPFILYSMIAQEYNKKKWFDATITYYMIKNGFYTILPTSTFVKNIGLDGSGVNCGINEKLQNEIILNDNFISNFDFTINDYQNKLLNNDLNSNFKIKFYKLVRSFYLLFLILIKNNKN